jgi:hypothetical protein
MKAFRTPKQYQRRSKMELFISHNNEQKDFVSEYLVKFNNVDLFFFLKQISAYIVSELEGNKRDAQKVLKEFTNWADHGYTNALQYSVEFLYTMLSEIPNNMIKFNCSDNEVKLFKKALSLYQIYKTNLIKKEKEEMGKNWGVATEFNQKDWTDVFSKLE